MTGPLLNNFDFFAETSIVHFGPGFAKLITCLVRDDSSHTMFVSFEGFRKGSMNLIKLTRTPLIKVVSLLGVRRIIMRDPINLSFIDQIVRAFFDHFKNEILETVLSHGTIKRFIIRFSRSLHEMLSLPTRRQISLPNINFAVDLIRNFVYEFHSLYISRSIALFKSGQWSSRESNPGPTYLRSTFVHKLRMHFSTASSSIEPSIRFYCILDASGLTPHCRPCPYDFRCRHRASPCWKRGPSGLSFPRLSPPVPQAARARGAMSLSLASRRRLGVYVDPLAARLACDVSKRRRNLSAPKLSPLRVGITGGGEPPPFRVR